MEDRRGSTIYRGASVNNQAEIILISDNIHSIAEALRPEIKSDAGIRSEITGFVLENGALSICMKAGDISALRASLNMWLRLIQVATEMHDVITR